MYISTHIHSPLWDLNAVADNTHLLFLDFSDTPDNKKRIEKLGISEHQDGSNGVLEQCRKELDEYFSGKRKEFNIPIRPLWGTEFQQKCWKALQTIPYGETISYKAEAIRINHPKAVRAIGWANHVNPIVIMIPCHRVIGASGKLVGYGWWVERKKWLLHHEKRHMDNEKNILTKTQENRNSH